MTLSVATYSGTEPTFLLFPNSFTESSQKLRFIFNANKYGAQIHLNKKQLLTSDFSVVTDENESLPKGKK